MSVACMTILGHDLRAIAVLCWGKWVLDWAVSELGLLLLKMALVDKIVLSDVCVIGVVQLNVLGSDALEGLVPGGWWRGSACLLWEEGIETDEIILSFLL